MSCQVCGSTTPCNCSSGACVTGCGCGNPTCCGNCGCNSPLPATPLPFYACTPVCTESHTQRVVLQQFYTTINIQSTWNVPVCGEEATVFVGGLKSANPGSYIWNAEYGYFEIVSFDSSTGQLVIKNNCNEGNAAAGTNVPACTEFNVTVPPCECPDDTDICVAIDFTAPEVGNCVDITLTTTQGVTASDTVEIGTGQYFVDAIKPNDIITICNQGFGITPGTPVIAQDVNGNYQYCLQIISTNPCDREEESEGPLIICNSNDVQGPLECSTIGWVPTALGGDESDVACRPVGSTNCANFDAALNITSGDATYANVLVTDSTGFAIGDIIEIAGGIGWTAEITGIPDATHIDITLSPVPSFNTTIADETLFCLQNCCDRVEAEIADLGSGTAAGNSGATTPGSIDEDESAQGSTVSATIVNPSTTNNMKVMVAYEYQINGNVEAVAATYLGFVLIFTPRLGFSTGAIGAAPAPVQADYLNSTHAVGFPVGTGTYPYSWEFTKVAVYDIAPGDELKIAASNQVSNDTPDAGVAYAYDTLLTKIEVLYVAVSP